ncbi:MAG: DUF4975 domain-containing protein [Clostridia bacterium]|nr:DUF4975 domain-containing protein [Clostridia bacterium]
MKIFYHPEDGRMGDIIPYYEDGVFKLFYLGMGWTNVSTVDQLHFYDEYRTGIYGGTGSVIKVDGIYHMYYCKFTFEPYMRQYVCHAVSEDLKTWKELPEETFQPDDVLYEMTDWRDPHVIWNEEEGCWWMLLAAQRKGLTMRKGCVGLCKSTDLHHWTIEEPLYAPRTNQSAFECPDIFRIGDWWYLTYSVYTDRFETLYRMAKSPSGPWITPAVDTFDTRCFYAAKHGTDGEKHFMYGWNPQREKNLWHFNPEQYKGKDYNTWDWGGTMIVHQLIQQPDGTLTVCPPKAVDEAFRTEENLCFTPLNGDWHTEGAAARVSSPDAYACLLMNRVPECCKLEMDVRFDETPREFGIALQVDQDFAMGYYLLFEPNRHRVQYKTGIRMYEDGGKMFPYEVEQERPFEWEAGRSYHVRVFVQDSILLLYVDDRIALGTRMFDRKGRRFGLFVSDGSASFERIRLLTE